MANIKGRWPKSLSSAKCHLILQSTSLESARGGQIDGRLLALRPRRVAVSSKPCISPSQFASSARHARFVAFGGSGLALFKCGSLFRCQDILQWQSIGRPDSKPRVVYLLNLLIFIG